MNKYGVIESLLNVNGFFKEESTIIDGMNTPCRPIYIEYLYLHPVLLKEVSGYVSSEINEYHPKSLLTIEASILPLATLVCDNLSIPLNIIRKPSHKSHEPNEPLVYYDEIINEDAVLFDDAIWSGVTLEHALKILKINELMPKKLIFLFDFMDLNHGGEFISEEFNELLNNRKSLICYKELLDKARDLGKLSVHGYNESLKLFK